MVENPLLSKFAIGSFLLPIVGYFVYVLYVIPVIPILFGLSTYFAVRDIAVKNYSGRWVVLMGLFLGVMLPSMLILVALFTESLLAGMLAFIQFVTVCWLVVLADKSMTSGKYQGLDRKVIVGVLAAACFAAYCQLILLFVAATV